MGDGELTVPRDRHTYFARHCLVWSQGSGRYLCSIDGNWGILRTTGWNYRQGHP